MDETTIDSTVDESIDLFADEEPEVDEPTSEATEDSEEAESDVQPAEEQTADVPQTVLDIVYNGQAMSLTKEQAVELAQKGMNYDKIQQKLNEAQNSKANVTIARLAQKNGVPVDALLDSLMQQAEEMEITTRANQLMDSEGYMDIDTAKRLARTEIERDALQNQQLEAQRQRDQMLRNFEQKQAERQRKEAAFQKDIADLMQMDKDFQKKYPTIESMPKLMQEAIQNGESIKSAYLQTVIEEQKTKIAAYEQNVKNASMSTGSASGIGASNKDAFLGALFGDD